MHELGSLVTSNSDLVWLVVDVRYEVTTYTSDVQGAGTDANVYVSMYGQRGHTGELPLIDTKKHKRKDCFERKSVDVCVVEVSTFVWQLLQLVKVWLLFLLQTYYIHTCTDRWMSAWIDSH